VTEAVTEGMGGLTQQATTANRILGTEAGPNDGKSGRMSRSAGASPLCPECGSSRLFKDGLRYLWDGSAVQRWLCRNCGYRFSEKGPQGSTQPSQKTSQQSQHVSTLSTQSLKGKLDILYNRRVCDLAEESKNLAEVVGKTATDAGATQTPQQDTKGKLLEYAWTQKKHGLQESTINLRTTLLKQLIQKGADLNNPDNVETVLATEKFTVSKKASLVAAYRSYTKTFGIPWIPIRTRYRPQQPHIPLESELDQIIAASGRKTAAFLQTLKDTGARSGEVSKLKWTDINEANQTVRINNPEKGSDSRTLKVSEKTLSMLKSMPKKHEPYVFNPNSRVYKDMLTTTRNRLARTLQNPRFKQIHLHTFRHWKATMEYAKTRDIIHVMKMLGHRNIQNTLIYTQLVNFQSDEYYSAVAKTVDEARKLVESGFTFVCDIEGMKVFSKRK